MKLVMLVVAFISVGAVSLYAGEINKSFFSGVAIEGYDPVAYFKENKPKKGNSDITYEWKDATWQFSSTANRDLFVSDPEKYAPQFGGHCANGMSEGHKVDGKPEIWRMIDGKLYLFYSQNGRERWSSNTDQWIKDAWRNWEKLKYD